VLTINHHFILNYHFILSSTYLTFNNIIYKQTFGTPMESPLSPIIADVVWQDLERKLNSINLSLPFYYRYVDDIILAAPSNKITDILNTFNSFHNRLQFIIEYEHNRCLSFLDLKLNIIINRIVIDRFQKKTFSGRFLFFIKIMRVRSLFFRGHSHLYTYFDSRVCACMRTCLLARGGAFMYTV